MKKAISVSLILLLILSMAACGSAKLSAAFDEQQVTDRSKEIVETINTMDYDSIVSLLREDLQSQISAAELEEAWGKQFSEAGAFVEFKQVSLAGTKSKTTNEDYAVAVLVCKYENATLTYTLSFDTSLNLVGLYMK